MGYPTYKNLGRFHSLTGDTVDLIIHFTLQGSLTFRGTSLAGVPHSKGYLTYKILGRFHVKTVLI